MCVLVFVSVCVFVFVFVCSSSFDQIYINVTNLSLGPNGTKYHCNFGQGRLSVASYENNTGLYFCTSPKMKIAEGE